MNQPLDPKLLDPSHALPMNEEPLDLDAWWMPFTSNRQFKAAPRMLVGAKDMYFTADDGRQVLDGQAGLWCVNAGHCREPIVRAIQQAAATLDFAPTFQMGHPGPFRAAERLREITPGDLDHVFFCNSGSEAVETALKMVLAYHRARGEGHRTKFVGRHRGYHGVNIGGMSVGGIPGNRKSFGNLLPGVSHLTSTHALDKNAFTRGQPEWGAHLADELESRIIGVEDASTIAAVIVEPMAGSAGVLIPPKGYLERLRAICDKHGIPLIFDEVITGFGRLGAAFAATRFGVTPDILICAKGLTNAAVPMGATVARRHIYQTIVDAAPAGAIEFPHGYTYSGQPLAAAAACATLDLYQREGLFERAASLESYFQDAVHSLRGRPNVIDIRNLGLVGAIELSPRAGSPGTRAYDVFMHCFKNDVLVRFTGDTMALSPPLIVEKSQIDRIVAAIGNALDAVA